MKKPSLRTHEGGLQTLVVPLPGNQTVTTMVLVRVGSIYEPVEHEGMSHLLEHMCFKGTETMKGKELMRKFEGMGAQVNAFTGHEFTGYHAKGPQKKWKHIAQLLADIYAHSVIPEEELVKEKGVVLGEIDMSEDDPISKTEHVLYENLYKGDPFSHPILGTKKSVSSISKEFLLQYRQRHYIRENTVIVISGAVDASAHNEVGRIFSLVPKGKVSRYPRTHTPRTGPLVTLLKKKTDQIHVMCALPTVQAGHKDESTLSMIRAILRGGMSSRLFERLREDMGSGYYILGGNEFFSHHGHFYIGTGTREELLKPVISAITEELERLKHEEVPIEELKRRQDYLSAQLQMGLETSDACAMYYGEQMMHPDDKLETPEQFIKKIKSVTAQDIQRVAKKYFRRDKFVLVVVGNRDSSRGLSDAIRLN